MKCVETFATAWVVVVAAAGTVVVGLEDDGAAEGASVGAVLSVGVEDGDALDDEAVVEGAVVGEDELDVGEIVGAVGPSVGREVGAGVVGVAVNGAGGGPPPPGSATFSLHMLALQDWVATVSTCQLYV